MKIAIIGYSGCGKSTLAKRLGEKYRSPVLYLDKVHWLPGWVEREITEEQNLVTQFMDENESWVIDGNYSKLSFERRMKEADKIVFMNFNRISCLFRALKRYSNYQGKTRESMTEGCHEKMDFEFLWWILHTGRTKRKKDSYQNVVKRYSEKVIVIKKQKQLNFFTDQRAR